jgi:hypothetical protein
MAHGLSLTLRKIQPHPRLRIGHGNRSPHGHPRDQRRFEKGKGTHARFMAQRTVSRRMLVDGEQARVLTTATDRWSPTLSPPAKRKARRRTKARLAAASRRRNR